MSVQTVSGNVQLLHQTGNDWMTPPVMATFATSGLSGAPLVAAAHTARQTLNASSFDGWDSLLHDPVLQKQDSTSLALSRWFNNVLGPWPIAQPDLTSAQRSLQQDGYGHGLPTDGAWTPEWNAAYVQAARDHYQQQLAGNRPGSVPPQKLLDGLVHRMFGAGMVDTLAGFVKSIPGQVRNVVSYVGGHAEQDFSNLVHGHFGEFLHSSQTAQQQAAHREASIARSLGSSVTDAQQHAQEFGNAVSALGTIFTLAGAGAAANGIRAATTETLARSSGLWKDLGYQEAVRGPGTVARTIGSAFSPERAYANLPILRTVGPQVGKLTDQAGLYYRARTLLAQPYRLPAVQIAGNAVGRASLLAAGVTGAAEAADIATPGNSALHPVLSTTTPLDAVDDAIKAHTAGLLSLDDVNLLLHAPLVGEGALSARVGNSVEGARAAIDEGLGKVGMIGAVQRATGLDYDQILAKWGGVDRFHTWARYKLAQMAANFHAENELRLLADNPNPERITSLKTQAGIGVDRDLVNNHGYEPTPEDITTHGNLPPAHSRDWYRIAQTLGHEAWRPENAGLLAQRALDLSANPHYVTGQLLSEIAHNGGTVDKWARQGVNDFLDAGEHFTTNVLQPHGHLLLTPDTFAAMRTARDQQLVAAGAGEARAGSEEWLRQYHAQRQTGSFGIARNDTFTRQDAYRAANQLSRKLDAAGGDLDARNQVAIEAGKVLQDELSMDGGRLAALRADTPEKLIEQIRDHGEMLASDVYLSRDAPAEAQAALDRLTELGYKPVHGTDVGHLYDGTYPQTTPIDGPITTERRVAEALGVSLERFKATDVSAVTRNQAEIRVQKLLDDPTFHGIPTFTSARDYLTYMDRALQGEVPPWGYRVGFAASPWNVRNAMRLAKETGQTREQAYETLRQSAMQQLNIRDYPLKKARDVLTNVRAEDGEGKPLVSWLAHVGQDSIPGLSDKDANRLAMALYGAYRPPAYMSGADTIGAMLRAPLAINGKPLGLPVTNVTTRIATLNNAMIRNRNQLRFALSPMFSFRRVAKTNLKLGVAGVQTTFNPTGWLLRNGVYEEAHRYLDHLFPELAQFHGYAEESLRALRQGDVFGLYNPTEYEAYAAHYAKTVLGKSDDQVRRLINTSFNYGSMTEEGRTAAERTTNFIFFPFSFEKTLYRNVGAHLLDHPGQALLLNQALQLYGHLNANRQVSNWVDAHAPLLKEFQHLNAFAYGVSPGELGGINAPLLNMLLPQAWAVNNATSKNLSRFIPAMNDFSRVAKEGIAQYLVLEQATANAWDVATREPGIRSLPYVGQGSRSLLQPRRAAETADAQFTDALKWRLDLIGSLKPFIDYNAKQSTDDTKYSWPTQSWVPPDLRGRPINKTTIGTLVHARFPKYNPLDATFFAVKRQEAIDTFVAQRAGTPYGAQIADWVKAARSAITYMNNDEYTNAEQAQAQGTLRQYAVQFAEKDPKFLAWYGKNFRSHFGPIDTLR